MNITVSPPAAVAAGCTASYSVKETVSPVWDGGTLTYYRLSATAAAGWRFDHFEWTYLENGGSVVTRNEERSQNPFPAEGARNYQYLKEGTYQYGSSTYVCEVTNCRAVFVEDVVYGDITVTTSADPAAGGRTTPVAETHQYAGYPETTFTLTATPNNGWRFVCWKRNGVLVSNASTTTVTHSFTSSAQTFQYVATFRRTGLILHGAGGAILHGTGGTILHSG